MLVLEETILARVESLPARERDCIQRALNGGGPNLEMALALAYLRVPQSTRRLLATLEKSVVCLLTAVPGDWNQPLILEDQAHRAYLPAFTSWNMAQEAQLGFANYPHVTPVDMVMLCQSVEGNLGLSVNPHHHLLTFPLSASSFQSFRDVVRAQGQPEPGQWYSVMDPNAVYGVVQVRAVNETHVNIDAVLKTWKTRPLNLELKERVCEGKPHPVDRKTFASWCPLAFD